VYNKSLLNEQKSLSDTVHQGIKTIENNKLTFVEQLNT